MVLKVGIAGATGRMGQALLTALESAEDMQLSHGLVRPEHGAHKAYFTDNMEAFVREADVVVDFTNPQLSLRLSDLCIANKTAMVCGTTGFDADGFAELGEAAHQIPLVWASNMSVGVNTLLALAERTAATLDEAYDIEIVEMHHRHKKDAPSGTAMSLGKAAAKGRKIDFDKAALYAREGITGEREAGTIGFATLRGGDVIGDHSVIFAGDGERVELTHKASDRSIYATGALRAAKWLSSQPAGMYSMRDVLGLA